MLDALANINGKYTSVWTYDATTSSWLRYIVGGPSFLNNLDDMEAGRGYWIQTTEDCSWDFGGDAGMSPPALAARKPPFVIYGRLTSDDGSVTPSDGPNVSLKVGNVEAASYVLGSEPGYEDYYVLEIPVDDSFHEGDVAQVYVDGRLTQGEPINLGGIGIVRRHDVSYLLTPTVTKLLQNYPNPFNPNTWIPYQLKEEAEVIIRIYAATGQIVRTLSLGHKPAGFYSDNEKAAYWDGNNEAGEPVASGIYFYTVKAGNFTATRKMVAAK